MPNARRRSQLSHVISPRFWHAGLANDTSLQDCAKAAASTICKVQKAVLDSRITTARKLFEAMRDLGAFLDVGEGEEASFEQSVATGLCRGYVCRLEAAVLANMKVQGLARKAFLTKVRTEYLDATRFLVSYLGQATPADMVFPPVWRELQGAQVPKR